MTSIHPGPFVGSLLRDSCETKQPNINIMCFKKCLLTVVLTCHYQDESPKKECSPKKTKKYRRDTIRKFTQIKTNLYSDFPSCTV